MLLYQNTIPILSENPEINARTLTSGISNKGAGTKRRSKRATVPLTRMIWNVNLTDQWSVRLLRVFKRKNKKSRKISVTSVCFTEKALATI